MALLIWNLMVASYRCELNPKLSLYNYKHLFMTLPWFICAFISGMRSEMTATGVHMPHSECFSCHSHDAVMSMPYLIHTANQTKRQTDRHIDTQLLVSCLGVS